MTDGRVAIIGGGFTGLTAAYRLSRADVRVTLYEASSQLGGLAAGFTMLGKPVERAYHFVYKTDHHMFDLLDELGLHDALTFHRSSVATYSGGVLYPMMSPADLLKFSPLKFHNRLRAGLVVLFLQRLKQWRRLSRTTAVDWLRRWAGREVTEIVVAWQVRPVQRPGCHVVALGSDLATGREPASR